MFPILPSSGLDVEKNRHRPAPANDHEYAQQHGRVVHFRDRQPGSPSRARLVLVAALVIITLALVVIFI